MAPESTPQGQGSGRRRRRGRGGSSAPQRGRRERRPKPPPPPAARLAAPKVDTARAADDALQPDEVAEMKRHLKFLLQYRRVLRLKVNAVEDLLLNGGRAPTHRGACIHLLSKVDLSCVKSMLTRTADSAVRGRVLAGVVRFSSDVGILLLYLEELAGISSRRAAASALSVALPRLDLSSVSDARLWRVLELIEELFDEDERTQVLFGLLGNAGFQRRFDRASLPGNLAAVFLPLRAVHQALYETDAGDFERGLVEEGARRVLRAPVDVLCAYPAEVRRRLVERAAPAVRGAEKIDRAIGALLDSFPRQSRTFSDLAVLRIGGLLASHRDGQARSRLEQLRKAHPGSRLPTRWLRALEAPRIGRVALGWPDDKGGRPAASDRLRPGFWLDGQLPVWLCTADAAEAGPFARSCRLHLRLNVAGIAALAAHGVTDEGTPYAAVPAAGTHPLPPDGWRKPQRTEMIAVCAEVARILNTLARLGLSLPDALPDRFIHRRGGVLLLADLSGLEESSEAPGRNLPLAAEFCRTFSATLTGRSEILTRVSSARTLEDLAHDLGVLL